jgi:hypothetical protein
VGPVRVLGDGWGTRGLGGIVVTGGDDTSRIVMR